MEIAEHGKVASILKGYLREFYTPLSVQLLEKYRKLGIEPFEKDYLVTGNAVHLKTFIAYYLTEGGRKSWEYYSVYDILNGVLSHSREDGQLKLDSGHLVISSSIQEFQNKITWDALNHFLSLRAFKNRRTLFFCTGSQRKIDFLNECHKDVSKHYVQVDL